MNTGKRFPRCSAAGSFNQQKMAEAAASHGSSEGACHKRLPEESLRATSNPGCRLKAPLAGRRPNTTVPRGEASAAGDRALERGLGGGDRIVGYESPAKWGINMRRFE